MLKRSGFVTASSKCSLTRACCSLIVILAVSHRASGSFSYDWNGTWKLDTAKSHIYGPTLRISKSPDGVYHNTGRIGSANFDCDSMGHQVSDGLTVFCTQKNTDDLEISAFKNGSKVSTGHWQLSNHGNALTIQGTVLQSDGAAKSTESHYIRTSGSTGFVGGWRNKDLFKGLASTLETSVSNNALHFHYPEKGIYVDAFLDGTRAAVHTFLFPSGATIALSERDKREVSLTTELNGQVVYVEYWQISMDGRSLSQSSWFTSRPSEKYVLVYEKQ
jgi:hypothetical protein